MSLDDLFSGGEYTGIRQPEPKVPPHRLAITLLVGGAAMAGLAYLGLRLFKLHAPILALLAAGVTLMLGIRVVRAMRPPPPGRHAGRSHEDHSVQVDGLKLAISRWDTMLDWCHTDVARFNRRVLPRLGELVDERLRQRHGITRVTEPDRARAILGDPLWTYVTMPLRRPPHPRELDLIVSALEKL